MKEIGPIASYNEIQQFQGDESKEGKKRFPIRRKKENPRRNLKGPATTSAVPFKPEDSNFQCHKCGGWGHGWKECVTKGNVDWVRIHGESEPKETETIPEKDQQ